MMIECLAVWVLAAAASAPVIPVPARAVSLDALLLDLRADAAQRSGLDPARLAVLPAEEVIWSDGSLGCAQPGRAYTQALVPGWRVRIQAGTNVLNYHASRRGAWVFCPAGRAAQPVPGTSSR